VCNNRYKIICYLTRYCNEKIHMHHFTVNRVELILLNNDIELFVTHFYRERKAILISNCSCKLTAFECSLNVLYASGIKIRS